MLYRDKVFQSITYEELYYTLLSIVNNDCYLEEFLSNDLLEELIYHLDVYDVVYIASDDRLLLTSKGEKLLQYLITAVELNKNCSKLPKVNL